jgi:hypothetical protein
MVNRIISSIINLLKKILHFIVPLGSPIIQAIANKFIAEILLIPLRIESGNQFLNGLLPLIKTIHHITMAFIHHTYEGQNDLLVAENGQETTVEQTAELEEHLRVWTTQHLYIGC